MNIKLNDVFENHCKEFKAKPVTAARYRRGMENGFCVVYDYLSNEGLKFFNTYEEAMQFYNEKPLQECIIDGVSHMVKCEYYEPHPVFYERNNEPECTINSSFVANESMWYDCTFLYDDSWIIKDSNGNIRVFDRGDAEHPFIGEEYMFMYNEYTSGKGCDEEWLQKMVS